MWLIEWFENEWPNIITFLTSGAFISNVILFIKTILQSKTIGIVNTKLQNLTAQLSSLNGTKESIDTNNDTVKFFTDKISELETEIMASNKRFGVIIDILGVVYMRSKDEDIRNAVSKIITTFEYKDDRAVVELREQVEYLKEQLRKTVETVEGETSLVSEESVSSEETSVEIPDTVGLRG